MQILIIEDEAAAIRRLKKMLKEIDPEIQIAGELDSITTAIAFFEQEDWPDLIFLDIQLADGPSFEIFNHIDIFKPIIFTTAYDQYTLEAFKHNTVDYLLKPIKKAELRRALAKYRKMKATPPIDFQSLSEIINRDREQNRRFLIRIGASIKLVELQEVAYFYTQNKITYLVTKEGKKYPIDYTLGKLEEIIGQRSFFRINRQFIIHLGAIREMYAFSKARVKIDLEPESQIEAIVSTERSPLFKKWLQGN